MSRSHLVRLACLALLLFVSAVVWAPAGAARADACFAYGICESSCPATTQQRPCLVVVCGTHTTKNCGSCTTSCVPPGD
jgi:hypothetical protein